MQFLRGEVMDKVTKMNQIAVRGILQGALSKPNLSVANIKDIEDDEHFCGVGAGQHIIDLMDRNKMLGVTNKIDLKG